MERDEWNTLMVGCMKAGGVLASVMVEVVHPVLTTLCRKDLGSGDVLRVAEN